MDKFLEIYNLQTLNQEERGDPNRPIAISEKQKANKKKKKKKRKKNKKKKKTLSKLKFRIRWFYKGILPNI